MYNNENIGNIETQMDSRTREEAKFNDRVKEICSNLTSSFETEFANLVHRIRPDQEEHLSMIIEVLSMLHQQESLIYMIQRECVSAKVAQTFIRWEGRHKEEKVGRTGGDQDSARGQQETINQVTRRMLDAQVSRISWSLWNKKSFPEHERLVWRQSTEQLRRWKVSGIHLRQLGGRSGQT